MDDRYLERRTLAVVETGVGVVRHAVWWLRWSARDRGAVRPVSSAELAFRARLQL